MASSGYLVSPKQDPSKEKIWTETWKRIDRFLPDLRRELALDEDDVEEAKDVKNEEKENKECAGDKVDKDSEE